VPDATSQKMLTEIKRDAFLQKADFSTPFDAQAVQKPLGEDPLLITDAQLSLQSNGGLLITFQEKSVDAPIKSCQLNLQANLVHGLVHLIQQAVVKANWGFTMVPAQAAGELADTAHEVPPRYTH
jgi:hypothetical protein